MDNKPHKNKPDNKLRLFPLCLLLSLVFVFPAPVLAADVEFTNLVISSTRDHLIVHLRINGFYTEKFKEAVLSGVPVTFSFYMSVNEVRHFWFNKKISEAMVSNRVNYDVLRNEFRIIRSWERDPPLPERSFDAARELMSEVSGLQLVTLDQLKKDQQYQIRAKAECRDEVYSDLRTPWGFKTDWYAVDFKY